MDRSKVVRRMDQNNNHPSSGVVKRHNNHSSSGVMKRHDRTDIIRRKRKPMMEKRRRARINASLEQLKKLVLDATRRDSARYSKLEKADILELTVKHIKDVQRLGGLQDPTVIAKHHDGFGECVSEVNRCLTSIDGVPPELHTRLMTHLSTCLQRRSPNHSMLPMFPGVGAFPPGYPMLPPQTSDAPFHPLSPGGAVSLPTATPLQNLPGARESSAMTSPAASPTQHPEARAFQAALLQAQACSNAQERMRCMERWMSGGRQMAAQQAAHLSQYLSRLSSLKQEQNATSKLNFGQESHLLQERMRLAFEKGEPVWRPW